MKITSVATVVLAVIMATCEGMTISCMSFVYVLKHCVHTGLDGHIAMVYIHVHRFESDCVNLLVLESLKIVFLRGLDVEQIERNTRNTNACLLCFHPFGI